MELIKYHIHKIDLLGDKRLIFSVEWVSDRLYKFLKANSYDGSNGRISLNETCYSAVDSYSDNKLIIYLPRNCSNKYLSSTIVYSNEDVNKLMSKINYLFIELSEDVSNDF